MRVTIAGIEFANPVIAASGTFGYGIEFDEIVTLEKLGGFVTKGLSRAPMAGNAAPRIIETSGGMMNAIGLQNIGVEAFIQKKLPPLQKRPGVKVIANVFGNTISDYIAVIERLDTAEGLAAYELNVSCPNTAHGGIAFGTDPEALAELTFRAHKISTRPIIIKLSPNVTSISHMARIVEDAGADAISLVNTFVSLAIDVETRKPRIANVTAGLSGPAIKPIAVRMVWEASRAVRIPIIGMGGIMNAEDAVEFMLAGATAIQIGTANYADPRAAENIANYLSHWCHRHNIEHASDLTGKLEI
jgi:dihydroorotate dehydrogenase (NAD+) catalytic subunit